MRIAIDMQGAQSTGSRNRGIGRYSMALSEALARHAGGHQIFLVLNGLFPDTIQPIRAAFEGSLPQESIRVWEAPAPVNYASKENAWRRGSAELLRESALASCTPDVVLVTSLFEGLGDDAVSSVSKLSSTLPTAVILYDLIPFIHRSPYLDNPVVESWYQYKLDQLRRADLLLAISESSRQEAINYLGFPSEMVVNISTAADPKFRPYQIGGDAEANIRRRYQLHRPFVMYTGGIDHRKNIEGLIHAYAKLPSALRRSHQLAIVCSIQDSSRAALESVAKKCRLASDALVLTGFVPDEDLLALYNLCKVFVFPSWHEGFGLPALEAMSCGRAVIGANSSSLPEVIGREDALFDPRDPSSIAAKLAQVLNDELFRNELEQNGLRRAELFSWQKCAHQAVAAFERLHSTRSATASFRNLGARRLRLAYISPLPPVRSGISNYSAELLPELSRHFEIEVIVSQDVVSDSWVKANCPIRSVEWFRANVGRFDRILYHFGNSTFHQHMLGLMEEASGVVVLHDFFLSHLVASLDEAAHDRIGLMQELYHAHGHAALAEMARATDVNDVLWRYPCNRHVLERALGVIVHSESSRRLAAEWYGDDCGGEWSKVPMLRRTALDVDRDRARRALGLGRNDFLVCAFGMLGLTKLNHRLLESWMASVLAQEESSQLVFVGENERGKYGGELKHAIRRSARSDQIVITGWVDENTYGNYLAAADIAVQLRTLSRGEMSASVLDCMNYGLPTIVNANGSMADLPDDAVLKIGDAFSDSELTSALETLWGDCKIRVALGSRAREVIRKFHAPRACADVYAAAIEDAYRSASTDVSALAKSLCRGDGEPADTVAWARLAEAIARSVPPRIAQRQLLVDVSEIVHGDARSGIQRVVRSVLKHLLFHPPAGYRVEPVFAAGEKRYVYARSYVSQFFGFAQTPLGDGPIEFRSGDLFLGLDLTHRVVAAHRPTYEAMRRYGVSVWFVVYDLLPVLRPDWFGEGMADAHKQWLQVVAMADGAVCISMSVAKELSLWIREHGGERNGQFKIRWFHLGADVAGSVPSTGLQANASEVIDKLIAGPSFLMVGTLEPRKGYSQVLAAFEILWNQGISANLVIVGAKGWRADELVRNLLDHSMRGEKLFWLEGISDEYLERVYASSTCMIAASAAEGFGLPLIEAAQHRLPIIARDIPVFREVAGAHAYYFSGTTGEALAEAVRNWMALYAEGRVPLSDGMPWLTWAESVQQLLSAVLPAGSADGAVGSCGSSVSAGAVIAQLEAAK